MITKKLIIRHMRSAKLTIQPFLVPLVVVFLLVFTAHPPLLSGCFLRPQVLLSVAFGLAALPFRQEGLQLHLHHVWIIAGLDAHDPHQRHLLGELLFG